MSKMFLLRYIFLFIFTETHIPYCDEICGKGRNFWFVAGCDWLFNQISSLIFGGTDGRTTKLFYL